MSVQVMHQNFPSRPPTPPPQHQHHQQVGPDPPPLKRADVILERSLSSGTVVKYYLARKRVYENVYWFIFNPKYLFVQTNNCLNLKFCLIVLCCFWVVLSLNCGFNNAITCLV